MSYRKKSGDSNDIKKFVRHYGVKGMRWGVQKSRVPAEIMTRRAVDTSKANQSIKAYMAANAIAKAENKPKTTGEATANLRANQKKFAKKFDGPDSDKAQSGGKVKDWWGGLDKETKSNIITGGVWVGLIGGAYIYGKKTDMDYGKIGENFQSYSGKKIDALTFGKHVEYSQAKSWLGGGYANNASFTRSGFDLPAGNTFHRLSTTVEDSFRNATYTTHSLEDYNRYVTAFTKEKGAVDIYHKTFTTTSPVKVPALTEVLGSLRTVLSETDGIDVDEKMTINAYEKISGGNWTSPHAKSLISSLKSKGYGALVDEMDAGVIGQSPLVFFDSENAVTQGVNKLSPMDKFQAANNLIEITNRKG